jgi:hypothetical protein
MRAAPRARPADATGPDVNTAAAATTHTASSATPGCPGKSPAPDAETTPATVAGYPPAPDPSQGGHGLPAPLARLFKTAQQQIDRHVNDHGLCAICGSAYPCERAAVADLALSAM